jgi:hypothetical protein
MSINSEAETIIQSNSSDFDQEAIANWVELCNEQGRLQAAGAEQEVLDLLRVQIIIGMTALLPNMTDSERGALALLLLAPMAAETITLEEAIADPAHNEETTSVMDINDEVDNIDPEED